MLLLRRLALTMALVPLALLPAAACGQVPATARIDTDSAPPRVPREFRAVWVATVDNMDWPSKKGLSTAQQQAELITILDKLVALRMNAIVLQVRPAADALYQSSLEPWSDVITGEMGRAPEPFYDPLAFATAESHKRGLEMHVWINPYRAKYSARTPASASHISRTHPDVVYQYGPYLWMDPGSAFVRARTTSVVLDLVRRYDIDAVHMDDYFYPYPETRRGREIDFPDERTYRRYRMGGGTLAKDDWRRENVNQLVKQLNDSIHAVKPWVRFGVSPFGIWRPGFPASVRGFDQYAKLYADARKWFNEGWVDYFTPQLYWAIDRPEQSYPVLLEWWAQQNLKGRHLWPGNYTGKVGFTNSSAWRSEEILEQIRLTRAQPGATGNVHFDMKVFLDDPDQLNERLASSVYAAPALVPASPWLGRGAPAAPAVTLRADTASGFWVLDVAPVAGSNGSGVGADVTGAREPWLWVVQARTDAGWTTRIVPAAERLLVLGPRTGAVPRDVRVTAVDRVGNAGPMSRVTAPAP
ncbi:MAG TPA: family 10 glycosylhydrolase [Gemmatimonadaceae bacterium]|nr:family 10 glycosylhydrolase [Gemmatimonadaceae bacterium]